MKHKVIMFWKVMVINLQHSELEDYVLVNFNKWKIEDLVEN